MEFSINRVALTEELNAASIFFALKRNSPTVSKESAPSSVSPPMEVKAAVRPSVKREIPFI